MGVQPNVISERNEKKNPKNPKNKNMGEIGVGGRAEKNWWYL